MIGRAFDRGDRGAVLPLMAVAIGVLILAAALAVDIGRETDTNRNLQSIADLASIDAVRSMTGDTAANQQAVVEAVALLSAARNSHGGVDDVLTVELGFVDDTGTFTPAAPTEVPNAVRVTADRPIDFIFANGGQDLSRRAVATRSAMAALTIGSFAASLDAASVPLLNDVLGSQLGGPVTLDLISYRGLADADITLDELAVAAGLGSVDDLLVADVTAAEFLTILATALTNRGDVDALAALGPVTLLQAAATAPATVRLGDLLGVDLANTAAAAIVDLTVSDLVQVVATAVNGNHLLNLDAVASLSDLIPGVVSASVKATVIEGKQLLIGPPGTTASTSQIRLYIDLVLLDVLGAPVHLPLSIDVARATAQLLAVDCTGGTTAVVTDVDPSLATIRIGELTDAELEAGLPPGPATILDVLLLASVDASANIMVDSSSEVITHHPIFDQNNTIRVGGTASSGSLVVDDLSLTVNLLGILDLGLDLDALLRPLIESVLDGLFPIVERLATSLGLTIGGADVTAFAGGCSAPNLAG